MIGKKPFESLEFRLQAASEAQGLNPFKSTDLRMSDLGELDLANQV